MECEGERPLTVLISGPKPVSDANKEPSASDVRLSVTGVDVKGQMFRHPATVTMLDGRNCVFRSESQPELDGSVLTEFNYDGANPQTRVSQARVKSNFADALGGYTVVVELEFAQTKKVNFSQVEAKPVVQKPAALPALPVAKPLVETKISAVPTPAPFPTPVPREIPLPAKISEAVPQTPKPKIDEFQPMVLESRIPPPKVEPSDDKEIEERIKSAVASEVQRELSLLKASISGEVEKSLPCLIASQMEKLIREDVENQFRSNYDASLQSLQTDVTQEIEGRLAGSAELQTMLQSVAKRFFEEHAGQLQNESIKAGEEMSSRAAAMMRPFEQMLDDMESKINVSRVEVQESTAVMQGIKQEIDAGLVLVQEALQQLREAGKPSIEQMQSHVAAQLVEWSTQFDALLNKSATEKAIQFSLDMERRMAPHRLRADESADKLGAMLQLLQGTARVQQERLNEHSVAAAANFEKQIRAFLMRLGGGA